MRMLLTVIWMSTSISRSSLRLVSSFAFNRPTVCSGTATIFARLVLVRSSSTDPRSPRLCVLPFLVIRKGLAFHFEPKKFSFFQRKRIGGMNNSLSQKSCRRTLCPRMLACNYVYSKAFFKKILNLRS